MEEEKSGHPNTSHSHFGSRCPLAVSVPLSLSVSLGSAGSLPVLARLAFSQEDVRWWLCERHASLLCLSTGGGDGDREV